MFRSLWTWHRCRRTPGKTRRTAFARPGLPSRMRRRGAEPAGGQVVQEGHPGIGALPGAEAEVEQDDAAVFQKGIGGQDAFFPGAPVAHRMELPIQEEVEDLQVTQIAGAPSTEVRLQGLGVPTDGALGQRAPEGLGVEAFDIPDREAADVGPGDQGAEFGGGGGQALGEVHREGFRRVPHPWRPEGERTALGLQGVGAIAGPVAGPVAAPRVGGPAQEQRELFLQAHLEHEVGDPGDEVA